MPAFSPCARSPADSRSQRSQDFKQAKSYRHRRGRSLTVRVSMDAVKQWIEQNLDAGTVLKESFNGSSGWSSAATYTMSTGRRYFVKTSRGRDDAMFRGEAAGLTAMYDTHTIRVPQVFHVGSMAGNGILRGGGSFIVMEYLDFSGRCGDADLGRQLALMHAAEPTDVNAKEGKFGFAVDNTIGGTAQPNPWTDDWVAFFREHRLRHMLGLVGQAGLQRKGFELCDKLDKLFEGVEARDKAQDD